MACRFVEDETGVFHVRPVFAIDREDQPVGIDFGKRIIARQAINGHALMSDQGTAALARAEAVFLEDSFELHGQDANIGP